MTVRSVLLTMMLAVPLLAQEQSHHEISRTKALWLSAAFPGLGELYLADWKFDQWGGGKYFAAAEVALWSGHFLLAGYSSWIRDDSRAFAAAHAGIERNVSKPARYYVNIGKFGNIYAYNELQRRSTGRVFLYDETSDTYWQWESEATRKEYDRMRIKSENTLRVAQYMFFGMIANRVLSLVATSKAAKNQQQAWLMHMDPLPEGGFQAGLSVHFYSQTLHP